MGVEVFFLRKGMEVVLNANSILLHATVGSRPSARFSDHCLRLLLTSHFPFLFYVSDLLSSLFLFMFLFVLSHPPSCFEPNSTNTESDGTEAECSFCFSFPFLSFSLKIILKSCMINLHVKRLYEKYFQL